METNKDLLPPENPFNLKYKNIDKSWKMTKPYLDSFLNKILGSKIEVYVMYISFIPYLDLNLFPTVDNEFKQVSKYLDKIF